MTELDADGPTAHRIARWPAADDLMVLIRAAELPTPVTLAGWSSGAQVAEVFARRYPGELAGLVLVDPTPGEPFPRADDHDIPPV